MVQFKTWFEESGHEEKQDKIKLAWERALDALTGMEKPQQAVTRSLGTLGGPQKVLGSLTEKGVFQALQNAGMSSAIDRVQNWLTSQPSDKDGNPAVGGRQVGDLLRTMFGEDMFRQLQGGEEPEKPSIDQAVAQASPQPPVDGALPDDQAAQQMGQDFPPTPEQPVDPGLPQLANPLARGNLKPPALQAAHTTHHGKNLFEQWLEKRHN